MKARNSANDIERRRAPRAQVKIPIQLTPRAESQAAILTNISESGICCEFTEAINEMTLLKIDLQLPGQPATATVQGAVVRCDKLRDQTPPTYEMGIFFTEMASETRLAIREFVQGQLQTQAPQ